MFLVTTVHFAAVNEFTFRRFITDPGTPEPPGRTGDPLQVQSVAAEIINVHLIAYVYRQLSHPCLLGNYRRYISSLEGMESLRKETQAHFGATSILDHRVG